MSKLVSTIDCLENFFFFEKSVDIFQKGSQVTDFGSCWDNFSRITSNSWIISFLPYKFYYEAFESFGIHFEASLYGIYFSSSSSSRELIKSTNGWLSMVKYFILKSIFDI